VKTLRPLKPEPQQQ